MGLDSVDGRFTGASGLGVTVTKGWIVPAKQFQQQCCSFRVRATTEQCLSDNNIVITRFRFIVVVSQVAQLVELIGEAVDGINEAVRFRLGR